ncbi:MAG TPA: sensor histidine kinase [Xanthomonadales bacterium]|nr:sensor histidine kinase [Xanthomonadales bacterium]
MKLNIRLKLLIGFTLLLTLSSLVQGFSFLITRNYISSQITSFQEVQAKKGASEIKDFFTRLSTESFKLGRVYQRDEKNFPPSANYVINNNNYIKKISILSPVGRELTKFDSFGQVDQSKLSYEVPSDPFKSAVSGNSSISKVYYIEEGLAPYLDTFSPIFGEKKDVVTGVIKMQINLTQLRNDLADIKLGENGYIYVADNEGRLIAHPEESFVLERPNLTSRKIVYNSLNNIQALQSDQQYGNEKDVAVIAQAVKIPGYSWIVVFEQPVSEAFGFLTFIRNIFIVTLIGSSIVLLLTSFVLSEDLTRSIRRLEQSAQLIKKGQIEKTAIIKSGDEIESLSYSFSSLIDQLMDREHSLEKATSQLEVANEKLKALDKLKDEFVSLASHELRTPMTAIKSYLWMTLQGDAGVLNDTQKLYLTRSYSSVERLIKLVNDMLNISRIESGRITIEAKKVNIYELAQEVVQEISSRASELGVHVIISKDIQLPDVLADSDKIKEVLINLLGNSLKFTPKDGTITISFMQTEGMVETKVSDTGAGISHEGISKLFQKFNMLPESYSINKSASGSGLGLYISRSIVELHKGKIWATSEGLGKGSQFSFSLRVFKEEDLGEAAEERTHEGKESVGIIHTQI